MPIVNVTLRDLQEAKRLLDEALKNIHDVFEQIKTTPTRVKTAEEVIERIYGIIVRHGGKITRGKLYREAKLTSDDLEKILTTLQNQGRIKMKVERTGSRDLRVSSMRS